ncbi:kinase [Novosphingobium sediminicola]|uniref:D-glycerate 3-kinase n=1 Tax=Novosphingobium sediminicola TaxID=563162 RepID=A0A7W6G6U0_9SPHN|nr:kinase [Novosphingobium sediminicola]MBB3955693.1 D-glycerate 3-kinase [Novosphingobium sediminicola]
MSDLTSRLIVDERLPDTYGETVDRWWRPLARKIADWHRMTHAPIVVGVNGAQGSGKSTLCRFLQEALLPELGLTAVTLSLDDLYLPLAERQRMAQEVHPLFRTRGVPGTHDVAMGMALIDSLRAGARVLIPRFSKSADDRMPPQNWVECSVRPDVILFEGWCVGARLQDHSSLTAPINALEAQEDPQGIWRSHVNDALRTDYARWFSAIDHMVMLKPPSFDHVLANRILQEHKLREARPDSPAAMDDDAVKRFVSHYERLTRHMLIDLSPRVDVLIELDARQNPVHSRGLLF